MPHLLVTIGIALVAFQSAGEQTRVVRTDDDRLKGITAVDVVVDPLPDDAGKCGLSRNALQEVAHKGMQAAGLKATVADKGGSSFFFVYVTVTTVAPAPGRQCASSVVTELMAQVEGVAEADRNATKAEPGPLLAGQMSLLRHQGVVSTNRSQHTLQLHNMVRHHLKAIGDKITAANGQQ